MTDIIPAEPAPVKARKIRVPPLNSIKGVRSEMSRVYRSARRGELDLGDATKLTYMLGMIQKCLESSEIEERLSQLEVEAERRR